MWRGQSRWQVRWPWSSPAPALEIGRLKPGRVQITARLRVTGDAAAAQKACALEGIRRYWNQPVQGVELVTDVIEVERGGIELRVADRFGRSMVPFFWAGNAPTVYLNVRGYSLDDLAILAAHEFGHVLGLVDRYQEHARGRPPMPGYEGNLMAGGRCTEIWPRDVAAVTTSLLVRLSRGLIQLGNIIPWPWVIWGRRRA